MKIEKIVKGSFTVIGKEGSTADGDDFIEKLWADANAHFDQISHLAKKDENGNPEGVCGSMSDFTHSFLPWEGFRNGLYLAGAECTDGAQAPDGWVKWVVPGYEYLRVENEGENTFPEMLRYMEENSVSLVGAVLPADRKKLFVLSDQKTISIFCLMMCFIRPILGRRRYRKNRKLQIR